jgi:hypothetical protein
MLTRRELLERTSLALGGLITGSAASAILAGCRANPAADWTPVLLSTGHAALVGDMVDHLLPATATPGARAVLVDRFIDAYLKDFASPDEQRRFTDGLAAFDATCRSMFGQSFAALTSPQRDDVFTRYEKESPPLAPTVWGAQISATVDPPVFYRQFKLLALIGYFTSTEVGETILAYDPIPGRFDGCVPLASLGGKAWSL